MSKTTPHNNYKQILNQNTFSCTQKPQFFKPKADHQALYSKGNPVTKQNSKGFGHF